MSPTILWSIALGIAFLLFAANSFWKSRISGTQTASGFILWQAYDHWFDFVMYPFVLGWLGLSLGFVVMFVVSLINNLTYIVINSKTETDWTLMRTFVELPIIRNIVNWKVGKLNIGKGLGFVFFAIKFDSFYAINYLYGKATDLRKVKVWILFLTSHVVCNLAWTVVMGAALIFGKELLKLIHLS